MNMQFEVTILGSNGAVPAYGRFPSAQVLTYNSKNYLIDCGEGTQFRMHELGIRRSRMDHIFISHLHGDHYFGLSGLITSLNLNHRETPLHIYGPTGLDEIINLSLRLSNTRLRFEIYFHPTATDGVHSILEDDWISVKSFPLNHRVPTTGFLFKENPKLKNILPEAISRYGLNHDQILMIKKGNDLEWKSELIPNDLLTVPSPRPRSYAYCSDTAFLPALAETLFQTDLIYHEATFMEQHESRAIETFHSTAIQAARVAKLSEAGRLIIGHFSARYADLNPLLEEARSVFPETMLAEEGKVFPVRKISVPAAG
jgi:ribonuclease Z